MIKRIIAAAVLAFALHAPVSAQAQAEPDKSFSAFLDQLWIDAKAEGHHAQDLRSGLSQA